MRHLADQSDAVAARATRSFLDKVIRWAIWMDAASIAVAHDFKILRRDDDLVADVMSGGLCHCSKLHLNKASKPSSCLRFHPRRLVVDVRGIEFWIADSVVFGNDDVIPSHQLGEDFLFVGIRDAALELEHCAD